MSASQPSQDSTSTSGSGSDDPPGGQRWQPERPRGVESLNSPPPRHPHIQGAFNIAAVHATPQSPVPKPDEAPRVRPTSADDQGIAQESGGVLAPRAGEVDLLHDDIGDLAKVQAQEAKLQRPRLEASRVGSILGGTQTLFSMLGAMPAYNSSDDEDSSSTDDEDGDRPRQVGGERGTQSMYVGAPPERRRPQRQLSSIDAIHRPIAARQPSINVSTPIGQSPLTWTTTDLEPAVSPVPRSSDRSRASTTTTEFSTDSGNDVIIPSGSPGGVRTLAEVANERVESEEEQGIREERVEMQRADEQRPEDATPMARSPSEEKALQIPKPDDRNALASLRQDSAESGNTVQTVSGAGKKRSPEEKQDAKKRRAERLAVKLKEVFGLPEAEELLVEMPCWLLRNLLLQGYMYLTTSHICFFARMPESENVILKTGPLSKRASRTKLWTKFWFVLKNDVLSWFESSTDPYFPKGNVSLQYASACEPRGETEIKLITTEKHYTFSAETEAARDDWLKSIQKVIFTTQHEGDNVKIDIPLEAVLSVDKSPTMEFADTIEITVVDSEDSMAVDSYFFAYFRDNDKALRDIQDLLTRFKQEFKGEVRPIRDSTDARRAQNLQPGGLDLDRLTPARSTSSESSAAASMQNVRSAATEPTKLPTSPLTKIAARINPFASSSKSVERSAGPSVPPSHPLPSSNASNSPSSDNLSTVSDGQYDLSGSVDTVKPLPVRADSLTYPPSRTVGPPPPGMEEKPKWGTSWLKPSDSNTTLRKSPSFPLGPKKVTEVFSSVLPLHKAKESSNDESSEGMEYSILEKSETGDNAESEVVEKFHRIFALEDKEVLLDHFPGYLYRVLPVSGRFFISSNYFCFRATQLMYKTKMMIPIKDILSTQPHKAYRIGHAGLLLLLRGHEELFLEFSSKERRHHCVTALEAQIEEMERLAKEDERAGRSRANTREAIILEELDHSISSDGQPQPPQSALPNNDGPSVGLFASTTSTLLDFKPSQPMTITCLTIGSRGDVQPYIALCKGLQAEGHQTRIASHAEYKDWVEGHGIEFASVGGDPAELMKMCVDNGMFTVSFLKEGLQKFRGWLDDLLRTSWEACQGSDLLIESPSAMGGLHIAEGLGIPYFRAFTMPWTRTRAYPHAFAVPSTKRGGAYNYMTYSAFDQVFWRAISGQVNRFRRKIIGIEPTDFNKMEQHKVPFLYNFSAAILPPPLDWYEWIHVTGYWFLDKADESSKKAWEPPQDLVAFIDNAHAKGGKVVYIGFGSIVVSDAQEMTQCIVDAVLESKVYCILSKGWSDRGKEKGDEVKDNLDGSDGVKYPPEIYAIDSIDHGWLFPRIDAAVHHGGAGTTGASLRAGIPTVIRPFFGDQFLWADRVEALNIGSSLRKFNKDNLVEALQQATTNEKQIEKAKSVGEMIRAENGVAKAIEAIYRDLDYAKSLIKPRPSQAESDRLKATDTQTFDLQQQQQQLQQLQQEDRSDLASSSGGDASHGASSNNGHSEDWSVVSGSAGRGQPMSRDNSTTADSESAGVLSGTDGGFDDSADDEDYHAADGIQRKKRARTLLGTLGSILPGKH